MLEVGANGGCLHVYLPSIESLFFLPLSGRRLDIDRNTVSRAVKPTTNQLLTIPRRYFVVVPYWYLILLSMLMLLFVCCASVGVFTHSYLETRKRVIGKQCRLRSGSALFANTIFHQKYNKSNKTDPTPLK